jgi:hypothetical protein
MLVDYPAAQLFVKRESRPLLMALGAGMLLTAIVLLGQPPRREVLVESEEATS